MQTSCPNNTKKEAPSYGRDFIYNNFTIFKILLKQMPMGSANVFSSTTQGPVEVSYV